MSQKMILENVRGSYVFVTEPRITKDEDTGEEKKGGYSIQCIIPKDHPQIKKIKALIKKAAIEKFGEKTKLGMLKLPLRDGDEERDSPEYEGCYFLNANAGRKPGVVGRDGGLLDKDDLEDMIYSGAYFHVSVTFYGFKKKGNRGVAVGLNNLMFRKHGERLDGSVAATSEFADYADEDVGGGSGMDDDDWDDDDL